MPAAQLFCEVLEQGMNTLLDLDPDSGAALQKLKGKRLVVSLKELPFDLLIVGSQRIDVMSLQSLASNLAVDSDNDVEVSSDKLTFESADCYFHTSLFTLPELRDSSRITQLIKQDKLLLEGDLQVAQSFSQLFLKLNIDWEEQLSKFTGDIVAHELFRFGRKIFNKADEFRRSFESMFADAAIEEKQLAAPDTLVNKFHRDVDDLQTRVEELEERITSFERNKRAKNQFEDQR